MIKKVGNNSQFPLMVKIVFLFVRSVEIAQRLREAYKETDFEQEV